MYSINLLFMKDISISKITQSYRLLGLQVGKNLDEIKQAFKKHRQQIHPDKFSRQSQEMQAAMTEKFIVVKEAYDFLSKNYDDIRKIIDVVDDFSMVSLKSKKVRSHITYSQISNL